MQSGDLPQFRKEHGNTRRFSRKFTKYVNYKIFERMNSERENEYKKQV